MIVGCLRGAVVVARDRAGADVDVLADRRVAEVREMIRLRPSSERRLLQLDEVADVRVFADVATAAAGARTGRRARRSRRASP